MVQQGYIKTGARYSARAASRSGQGEDAAYPAGRATVQAGLRSYALNKAEQKSFAHSAPEYREARCGTQGCLARPVSGRYCCLQSAVRRLRARSSLAA